MPSRNQAGLGLQGGVPGNRASWNSLEESVLDTYIFNLVDKNIDLKRVTQALGTSSACHLRNCSAHFL